MPKLTGYKWLTDYAEFIINDREVAKEMAKDVINTAARVKFDTQEHYQDFLKTTLRNRCYNYLKLKEFLS